MIDIKTERNSGNVTLVSTIDKSLWRQLVKEHIINVDDALLKDLLTQCSSSKLHHICKLILSEMYVRGHNDGARLFK